jgi:hypothetical protein
MLKSVLKSAFPRAFGRASQLWNGRKARRFSARLNTILAAFTKEHGLVVTGGPFAGMTYVPDAASSALLPKLVGSYESELHEVIALLLERRYSRVIDVGCAEGYYAIGFARALPSSKVFAFDSDPKARELCEQLAAANRVADRVSVLGECTPASLAEVCTFGSLIVCDCEGYEGQLLRPNSLPQLLACDFIVELHDFASPGIKDQIVSAFGRTHDCQIIEPGPRDPSKYPQLGCLAEKDRLLAMAELRYQTTRFAYLHRKAAGEDGSRPK